MISAVADPVLEALRDRAQAAEFTKARDRHSGKSIRVSYQRDPSPANVEILVRKAHEFFTRYENVFTEEFAALRA